MAENIGDIYANIDAVTTGYDAKSTAVRANMQALAASGVTIGLDMPAAQTAAMATSASYAVGDFRRIATYAAQMGLGTSATERTLGTSLHLTSMLGSKFSALGTAAVAIGVGIAAWKLGGWLGKVTGPSDVSDEAWFKTAMSAGEKARAQRLQEEDDARKRILTAGKEIEAVELAQRIKESGLRKVFILNEMLAKLEKDRATIDVTKRGGFAALEENSLALKKVEIERTNTAAELVDQEKAITEELYWQSELEKEKAAEAEAAAANKQVNIQFGSAQDLYRTAQSMITKPEEKRGETVAERKAAAQREKQENILLDIKTAILGASLVTA